jgi:hypothetical protein
VRSLSFKEKDSIQSSPLFSFPLFVILQQVTALSGDYSEGLYKGGGTLCNGIIDILSHICDYLALPQLSRKVLAGINRQFRNIRDSDNLLRTRLFPHLIFASSNRHR